MSRVFWDTNLFVYLIEDFGALSQRTADLRSRMLARGDRLVTSCLTLGEVLVKPTEADEERLRREYERAIMSGATVIPFDASAARLYASIRHDRSIRPPDAIQLACAANAQVDLFITNDSRLSEKVVPGVQFIASLERAFL